jgi:hypothetical protein
MSYGCFVDIQQQDGNLVRMHYENMAVETVHIVHWIGAQEQMGQKFRDAIVNQPVRTRELDNA